MSDNLPKDVKESEAPSTELEKSRDTIEELKTFCRERVSTSKSPEPENIDASVSAAAASLNEPSDSGLPNIQENEESIEPTNTHTPLASDEVVQHVAAIETPPSSSQECPASTKVLFIHGQWGEHTLNMIWVYKNFS